MPSDSFRNKIGDLSRSPPRSAMTHINFDANATYGCLPEVIEGVRSFLSEDLLNPSSIHLGGQRARGLIEEARDSVGALVGASKKDKVIFTSGATEANNWVFSEVRERALALNIPDPKAITTSIEHPSILEAASRFGVKLIEISPSVESNVQEILRAAPSALLASIMYVNNETGFLFPVKDIFREIRSISPNILLHSDAVQALGKIDFSFSELGSDLVSISGHKIGSLSGVGALVIKDGVSISPFIAGGAQEGRLRAGTENVVGIISFGIAAKEALRTLAERKANYERYRAFFEREISSLNASLGGEAVSLLNLSDPHLSNTFSLRVRGLRGDDLVVALDLEGIAVSSGSACSSGKPEPSHVLLALGYSEEVARETIRVSFKASYAPCEFERGVQILISTIQKVLYGRKAA